MEATQKRAWAAYFSIVMIVGFWLSTIRFVGARGARPLLSLPEAFARVLILNTVIITVITALTKFEGSSFSEMGFRREKLKQQFIVGLFLGPLTFVFYQVLLNPIAEALVPGPAPLSIVEWFHDLDYIPLWFIMALYGGGMGEELTRVFVLTRFEKLWGRPGLAIALALHAAAFGAAHLYQGPQAALGLGIFNLALSLVFLYRRSALEMILAHATFDLIGITLGFLTFYEG